MPIYEYECEHCGVFDVIQSVSEKPLRQCPRCKEQKRKSKVKRLVSAAAFHLKGTGWYKTDYASGSSKSDATSKKSAEDSAGGAAEKNASDSSGGKDSSAKSSSKDSGTKDTKKNGKKDSQAP